MPNVIDLFAGAGGLSLGASRAGFRVAAAFENDKFAVETHLKNFPSTKHSDADIATLSGADLLGVAGLEAEGLDGLIGGPPCQGFSTIGRRDVDDCRNNLFGHFFDLVRQTQPKFFLAENVPGIMDVQYDELRNQALNKVADGYVVLDPIPVAAHKYGAPTTRTRIFFIGYKREYFDKLDHGTFAPAPDTGSVTVKMALQGLPRKVSPDWQTEEQGWRRVGKIADSPFGEKLRGQIPAGVGHPESLARFIESGRTSGCLGTRHSPKVTARYAEIGAGERDSISKAVRLDPNGFCPTLRAGTGKDKGSYQAVRPLHPIENRVITPREAARLQGFPDWFVFHRTKWHSFRQIGNSVSPIAAEYLLRAVFSRIRGDASQ